MVFVDLVKGALEDAGIHTYIREETVTGLKLALSVMPTGEPGLQFVLFVPNDELFRAVDVMKGIPFDEHGFRDVIPWMHKASDPRRRHEKKRKPGPGP